MMKKAVPPINENIKRKAFNGAVVGDAATMPLTWIYDPVKLLSSITSKDKSKSEFNSIVSCPFFNSKDFPGHYKVGQPSPSGEQFIAFYKILNGGANNVDAYASQFKSWLKTYTGRKDGPSEGFEKNYENELKYPQCGVDDDQAMSLYKAVLALIIDVELEPLVRFHQNNDIACDCATFMYSMLKAAAVSQPEKSLKALYDDVKAAAPGSLKSHLLFLDENLQSSTSDFLQAWGDKFKPGSAPISCHNPQALLRVLHISIRATSFEDGIRTNILVAGSNALTGMAAGALLALCFDIPDEWTVQTKSITEF